MRIVSGQYKGRIFTPPKSFRARPTTDYARESLFNILSTRFDFEELEILDLFSGTGSITLEFASRGVASATLVEKDGYHIDFINKIVSEWGISNVTSHRADVRDFLRNNRKEFDLIFADPPYALKWLNEIPDIVLASGALKSDGIFILEHPDGITFNDHPSFVEHRFYGNVNFSFFNPTKKKG